MRHLNLVVVSLALGCGGTKDSSVDMELIFPCTDDCVPSTAYTGSVEVSLPTGHAATMINCKVVSESPNIEVGPASGPVGDMAPIITGLVLNESMISADADFQYRCTGDGGRVRVDCTTQQGIIPAPGQEIRCPTTPEPTGPTCGVVIVIARGDFTTSNFRTQVAVAPANSADATAADGLAAAFNADAIPMGMCADTPTNPTFTAATDLGQSIELKNGSTVLQTISKGSGNFYSGFGGMGAPPFGQPLTIAQSGAGVTPAALDAGMFPEMLVVTSPAEGAPAVITGGQDYTVTWTPAPGLTSIILSFGTDMKTCRFNAAAGTGTVPGTITSGLTDGGGFTILGLRAGKSAANVAGTACVLKTTTATGSGRTIQKQ